MKFRPQLECLLERLVPDATVTSPAPPPATTSALPEVTIQQIIDDAEATLTLINANVTTLTAATAPGMAVVRENWDGVLGGYLGIIDQLKQLGLKIASLSDRMTGLNATINGIDNQINRLIAEQHRKGFWTPEERAEMDRLQAYRRDRLAEYNRVYDEYRELVDKYNQKVDFAKEIYLWLAIEDDERTKQAQPPYPRPIDPIPYPFLPQV